MFKKTSIVACIFVIMSLFCMNVFALPAEQTRNLATKLGMEPEKLHSLLTSEDGKKELLPMTQEHLDFYVDLYCNEENAEHMKYYGFGKLLDEDRAQTVFERRIDGMWNSELPANLAFIVLSEGEYAGFIGIGPLISADFQPEIGRVIEKSFAGKGLGTFCAQTVVKLLQYLKTSNEYTSGKYNYTHLISTSRPENEPSRRSVMKAGFVTDEQVIETVYGPRKVYKYAFQ